MRGQVAIGGIKIGQPVCQEREMPGLVIGHTDPVVKEGAWQARFGEPHDDVPGKIDCIELDMGEGMQQCDPARRTAIDLATRHR